MSGRHHHRGRADQELVMKSRSRKADIARLHEIMFYQHLKKCREELDGDDYCTGCHLLDPCVRHCTLAM